MKNSISKILKEISKDCFKEAKKTSLPIILIKGKYLVKIHKNKTTIIKAIKRNKIKVKNFILK